MDHMWQNPRLCVGSAFGSIELHVVPFIHKNVKILPSFKPQVLITSHFLLQNYSLQSDTTSCDVSATC